MDRKLARHVRTAGHAAEAVREAARLWTAVVESMETALCVVGTDGTLLAHNRAWRELHQKLGGSPGHVHDGTRYLDALERARAMRGPVESMGPSLEMELADVLAGRTRELTLALDASNGGPAGPLRVRASRLRGSVEFLLLEHELLDEASAFDRGHAEMFRLLAKSMPSVMYRVEVVDGVRRFLYVSPAVEELFEVTAEAVYADADALWNQVVELDRSSSFQSLHTASPTAPRELDFRVRTPSGEEKWVHSIARPHRDEHGHVSWIGVLSDITARRRAEQRLSESESTYRTLFETVAQGVVYQDREGRITAANPSAQRILGLTLDQMQGKTSIDPRWRAIREDGTDLPGEEHPAMLALRSAEAVRDVVMGVCRLDGTRVWILVNAIPLSRDGRVEQVYASFEDITERVELAKELKRQATTDFVTGIANRRSFMERLHQELERARRHSQVSSVVASLDLDHFKQVNDTHGHSAGDAVLQHFAAEVAREIRGSDFFARTGGEEFSLLLPETTPEQALALAERLRRALAERPALHAGVRLPVSVSIGLAKIEPADTSTDELLARADLALYEAKHAGRDCARYRVRESR
jgi:diguanylate cyclase (GGDEF)-like protein/PAS domain S-box-containing protein